MRRFFRRHGRWMSALVIGLPLSALLLWMALWVWPRPTVESFHAHKNRQDTLIVLLSGDLGFHGATRKAAIELVDKGFDLVAVDSRHWFHGFDALQADSRRLATLIASHQQKMGDRRIILSGISFGADILPFTHQYLTPDIQKSIIGYALVVPSNHAYFKTDWHEHLDWGGISRATLPALHKLPLDRLVCVYGIEEDDSVCPLLDTSGARMLGLPGGHLLNGQYHHVVAFLGNAFATPNVAVDP